ncbi:hypothetical protein [Neisseria meningitidis]|uniref:hypothetical protein n=1 Tax=Neisseria meningitidis TaxID=487 RepID=UPI000F51D786|nr:hypothetical protein [Neisseria meningitidis]RQL22904.1 hypothetical protein COH31_08375 [Neisseria meningitidis]
MLPIVAYFTAGVKSGGSGMHGAAWRRMRRVCIFVFEIRLLRFANDIQAATVRNLFAGRARMPSEIEIEAVWRIRYNPRFGFFNI